MPPLTETRKREIDIAITAGRQPRRTPSNMTVLSTGGGRGRSYQILADAAAKLTPAGRYYYEQTGQQPPRRMFDDNQEPITRGANTYSRGRDNREMLVRSQRPDGSTRITAVRTLGPHQHLSVVPAPNDAGEVPAS